MLINYLSIAQPTAFLNKSVRMSIVFGLAELESNLINQPKVISFSLTSKKGNNKNRYHLSKNRYKLKSKNVKYF